MKRKHRRNRLKKGWGSVYMIKTKNKDGSPVYRERPWVFRYKGKYMGYYETEEEAMMAAFEFHKNPVKEKEMTFSELWKLWLEQKSATLSKSTVRGYASRYRKYCKPLYDKNYPSLRTTDFLRVVNVEGASNVVKNAIITFLGVLDSFAFEIELIDKKYTENIRRFPKEKIRQTTVFSEEDIEFLWDHLGIEDVDLVLILLYTGLRSGELAALKLDNIHSDYLIGGSKTEAGKNRYVPIHPRIKPLIQSRVDQATGSTLLNISHSTFERRFNKLMKFLGWKHHPHECRHTFITRLDNAGANRVCINLIVGHAGEGIGEQVYTHKTKDQLQETVKLLV